ncbi:beta-1,6-N-acetylglucosaminyltransferase [Duganella sp. S19_KUP01_CR8]|uniref:beta-1,6-N-acetylglucosaminyltransferase n=1 Tax=Duganella sp. S19_KUP01_CR8 TaxID=3025502 RepID=UPI002FCDD45E
MKIAYLILAHDQPAQFGRLLAALDAPGVSCFVHIDGKSDEQPFRAAAGALAPRFVGERVRVNWGGYSQVEAMLRLLRLAHAHGPHDYYLFLSGRDYPLRDNQQIHGYLSQHQGQSFMNFYPLVDGTDFVAKVRNYCYYDLYAHLPGRWLRRVANRLVRTVSAWLPERRFIDGMTPYRGSTSWCLTQPVVDYLIGYIDSPASAPYVAFFRSVNCADEIFFQTLVLNSPLRHTLRNYEADVLRRRPGEMVNENKVSLHYIDWTPGRGDPAILDERDWPALQQTDKLFARKFDAAVSAALLARIDSARQAPASQQGQG